MNEDISNQIPPSSQAGKEREHFAQLANEFFHRSDGIFLICLLLFGLTVWTFVPALNNDFQLFDDGTIFVNNAHVNTGLSWQNVCWALFSTDYSYSYPLPRISHMLDFEIYGAAPWGHHLTNVLIHAANGVLLFLLLKRMTSALWRSLIVAGLFALHPLRVESVAWVSERKDVMSAFFGLLALWTYARFAEESKIHGGRTKSFYGLTLLFFAFALMSKSILVTFPCLLLVLDFWPLERWRTGGKWILLAEKGPFFLLAALVSIATWFASKAGEGTFILHLPWSMRLETAVMGYGRYLGLLFWPAKLSAIYPYPAYWPAGSLLCAGALFLAMSALALAWQCRRPYFLVGWLWYVGSLVPVIGLIPLGGQSICTRFTYIPIIGALLLLVWGIDDLTKRWRQRAAIITAIVMLATIACIIRTRAEIVYWKDSVTLYNRAIAVTTNNFMVHYCLAEVLSSTEPDEALAEFQKSVDIYPDYALAQLSLAWALNNDGRVSEAIIHLEKATQLEPQNELAQDGLGELLFQMNRVSDAIPHLLIAIEIDPQVARFKDVLGQDLSSSEHGTEVISNILATARLDSAGFDRFLEAMQYDTNHVGLINNLAWAFATNPDSKLRNDKYAVLLATRACEMTGFQMTVCVGTLAASYAEAGRFDEAILTGEKASALASEHGDTDLLKQNQDLLTLYQAHQPYHEPVKVSSP